jgi:hypothetical protein
MYYPRYDTIAVTCNGWERDPVTKKLRSNPTTWPRGYKALIDYLHERKLKICAYSDVGKSPTVVRFSDILEISVQSSGTLLLWLFVSVNQNSLCSCSQTLAMAAHHTIQPELSQTIDVLFTCYDVIRCRREKLLR